MMASASAISPLLALSFHAMARRATCAADAELMMLTLSRHYFDAISPFSPPHAAD